MRSEVVDIDVNKEMQDAYLQYSMSVIVGRALPDVRDGIKPVHRRVLFAMHNLSNTHNKPYKKSARVVGDVIGKYHPHGDMAVYDTIVRMAQSFSLRYPLVDGQGNFGSIDGDAPAAQRYTEVRMTKVAEELLEDIEKDTVAWGPNYDDSLQIPLVLPARVPHLLVNGSSGIAVGMATNIPPHNLVEVVDACLALIENPSTSLDELIRCIQGPDFPTAGVILGRQGIVSAYKTGRGVLKLRAVTEIETKNKREYIVVSQLPYQVNKARLIEAMANLVRDKKIEGISDIRDESSREGMRIVIQLKRDFNPQVILNQLYKFTQLQSSFGIIMLALDERNRPRLWNLKAMLEAFISHRKNVVTRRCIYELKKAQSRAHILQGLKKALEQIDAVIACIKKSKETALAKANLVKEFAFSVQQAQAILEMRLQRLTGLEREKIENELNELLKTIEWLKQVLSDDKKIYEIIAEELQQIKEKYGDERRTQIEGQMEDIDDEDLIQREDMVVSITNEGRIKRIPTQSYRVQKRGGRGLKGSIEEEGEEFVSKLLSADTLTTILCLSNKGKMYWLKVHKIPLASRVSKGRSIRNVVQLEAQEQIRSFLPVTEFAKDSYLIMITKKGVVKKTELSQFERPRTTGLIALKIDEDDEIVDAKICHPKGHVFIFTRAGQVVRFEQSDVRSMGRVARGVRGIKLNKVDDRVIGIEEIEAQSDESVLIVTEKGYGKRSMLQHYRVQARGGVGVRAQSITDKVGPVVATQLVSPDSEVMLMTNKGQSIRMKVSGISILGRNTQGVRLINLKSGERVTGMTVIEELDKNTTDIPASESTNK